MKKTGKYFAAGCVVSIIGMLFSVIFGELFAGKGMDYGSACLLMLGMYLCVVIVTCTGIIVSKIGSKSDEK